MNSKGLKVDELRTANTPLPGGVPWIAPSKAATTLMKTTTAAERRFLIEERIRAIQREHPDWDYSRCFNTCNAAPEMKPVFDAMQKPATPPARPKDVATLMSGKVVDSEISKLSPQVAGARFVGKVQEAQHSRGISYDRAWTAMQREHSELFAAMSAGAAQYDTRQRQPLDFNMVATG